MDRKSKLFIWGFFSLIIIAFLISFIRFYVLKDYLIKVEVECDPKQETCFVYTCDPTIDTECPEDPNERMSYYKIIEKKASQLPVCENDSDCQSVSCQISEEDCQEILCDEETKSEDEECSQLEEFMPEDFINQE